MLPPVLIPLPFMSEVDALLPDFQPPGGPSLTSDPALDLWVPEETLRLPELLYMLPSLLPTAYPSLFTEGSARPVHLKFSFS